MKNLSFVTKAAMIAACYVVLTVVFAPFGFGEVQVRISEMLAILPIFTPAAIPGLFVGCIMGNILGGGYSCCNNSTHRGKCRNSTFCIEIRIRVAATDSIHDANCWNRRGDFMRSAGNFARKDSKIKTERHILIAHFPWRRECF